MMWIPELIAFAALVMVCCVVLIFLSEPETLEEYSERQHVNRLADESKKRKAPGMRKPCRYARAMWKKQ